MRLYGAARDITERVDQEQRLRDSEARYRGVVESAPDVIFTLALDTIITSLNAAFEAYTGWLRDDWLHKPFASLLHLEDVSLVTEVFQRMMNGEAISEFRLRLRTKAGGYKLGEFRATPQLQGGRMITVLGIWRDITDRIKAEEELIESRRLLVGIADTLPAVLLLYDLEADCIVYINSKAAEVLGSQPQAVVGKKGAFLRALVPEKQEYERLADRYAQLISAPKETIIEAEFPVQHTNGEIRWLHGRGLVFRCSPDGLPQQLLITAQDVTERKRLEKQLQQRAIQPTELRERLRRFREDLDVGVFRAELWRV